MNLKNLQYFIQVVRSKSFTKASEDLFVSQSTISKAVKKLEEELDCQLLNRSNTTMDLTRAGEIVLKQGEGLLMLIDQRTKEIQREIKKASGYLVVGIPPIISTSYFGPIVYDFKQSFPNIAFQVIETGGNALGKMLVEESIDIAMLMYPSKEEDIHMEVLIDSYNVVVVPEDHPLADRGSISLKEVSQEDFILLDDNYQLHDEIIRKCKKTGYTPRIIGKSYQWDYIVEKIQKGNGISILPSPLLKRLSAEGIAQLKIREPEFPWSIGIATKKGIEFTEEMETFINYTKQMVKTMPTQQERS